MAQVQRNKGLLVIRRLDVSGTQAALKTCKQHSQMSGVEVLVELSTGQIPLVQNGFDMF